MGDDSSRRNGRRDSASSEGKRASHQNVDKTHPDRYNSAHMAQKLLNAVLRLKWFILVGGVFVLLLAAYLVSRQIELTAPSQPIAFSHQTHSQAEIQCLFCHPHAMRSDIAGIPSVERCAGCHQVIAKDRIEIQDVLGFWDRGEPIPWEPVVQMPDHVFFSHQPHLAAGVSCETCHGDVGKMSVARPVIRMDMGWCLECHLDQPEENVARLADCLACHE